MSEENEKKGMTPEQCDSFTEGLDTFARSLELGPEHTEIQHSCYVSLIKLVDAIATNAYSRGQIAKLEELIEETKNELR